MENKEIYIDGVDVSGCDACSFNMDGCFYECKIKGFYINCSYTDCEDNPNCHYKQLKRKEQELETICKAFDIEYAIDEETGSLIGRSNKLQKKEQECEELKEDLRKNFEEKDTLHLIIDRLLEASGYDTNTASAEDFEDVYKHMRYEQQQLDKLKQTLTEIKSILELYANSKVGEEQPDGTYQLSSGIGGSFGFGFCTTTYDPRPARQALQKISEVEDGNN